ncbi:hypothetical protein [Brevibacillus sp. SYSU BS000544]|uniref:hypothetical protein n=1 Tax=Brevibacillus sp. SYSU BS000544 TaxID=3416443 RepID=UPI003CE5B033
MSANPKLKVKVKNSKVVRSNRRRKNNNNGAVKGIQESGQVLAPFFNSLRNAKAAALVARAIRCEQKKLLNSLLPPSCEVVKFYKKDKLKCALIKCVFGDCCDVVVMTEVCVRDCQTC